MRIQVICYSGYKGDERPVRFRIDEQEFLVEQLIAQWYEPEGQLFRVRASDGRIYVLRRILRTPENEWRLDKVRDAGRVP